MRLSSLSNIINIQKIYNLNKNNFFSSITSNSKFTNKKTILIYDKNSKAKKIYIKDAVRNQTPAIITNKYLKFISIPQFIVSNINKETDAIKSSIKEEEVLIALCEEGEI